MVLFERPQRFRREGTPMTVHTGRHFLQIPGPTNIPDRVLRAMDMPGLDHRGAEFAELGFAVMAGMQRMFRTKQPVIIYPSSGTGAWEAAIVNTLAPGDKVVDGDFESDGMGPWTCAGSCGVDHGLGNQHTGTGNGWVRYVSGWNDIHQDVAVAPNTDYTLTGWIRTSSNNTDGYFGVRDMQTNVISEQKYGNLPGYTELTVNFNSGDRSEVEVYGGVWALGSDTWAQLDDISITAS